MKRREILRLTAAATGSALCAPLVSSVLTGCSMPETSGTTPETLHFFSPEEFRFITVYADTILPETDSPSASSLSVNHIIDQMVGTVYPQEDARAYREGFNSLMIRAGADFTSLDAEKRKRLLLDLESEPETPEGRAHLHIKQQTVAYYLSTEEIGKNYLVYLPVPGGYDGCISLAETDGKAWAL